LLCLADRALFLSFFLFIFLSLFLSIYLSLFLSFFLSQITAVSFSPDGLTVAGGLIQGQLFFYEYEGMKYITQMDCRNRNGKYKKGSKVSGIAYYQKKDLSLLTSDSSSSSTATGSDPANSHLSTASNLSREGSGKLNTRVSSTGSASANRGTSTGTSSFFHSNKKHNSLGNSSSSINQILVTTNDNRIRLCSLEDYSTVCKYKGLKNRSMQIKSTFSDDCDYIICGSEYGQVFIWKTFDDNIHFNSKMLFNSFLGKKDILRNKLYENFDANEDGNAVICALFTPIESVRRYVKSHKELLYELLQNSNISSYWLNEGGSASGSHQDGNTLSTVLLGGIAAAGDQPQRTSGVPPPSATNNNNPTNKGADLSSLGLGTRIICTADFNGQIRVFFRIN
jgi:hypothetical protein